MLTFQSTVTDCTSKIKCRSLAGLLLVGTLLALPSSHLEAGEIGKFIRNAGKTLGIKPIETFGEKAGAEWARVKKKVTVIGKIEHLTTDQTRDLGRWVKKHPEDVLLIAVVATVGWAACVDGCTLVGAIVLDGATTGGAAASIPVIAFGLEPSKTKNNASKPNEQTVAKSPSSSPSKVASKPTTLNTALSTNSGALETQHEKFIAKREQQEHTGTVVYKRLDERLGYVFNSFAPPVYPIAVRTPSVDDGAGGVFLSTRADLGSSEDAKKAKNAFDDARRVHGAIDFLAFARQPVFAPLTGIVDPKEPWVTTSSGFKGIRIVAPDGTLARVLYITPDSKIKPGTKVTAGVTQIGAAVQMTDAKEYKGIPNHVHVDFTDFKGRRFDPWTNVVLDPRP